MIIKRLPLLVAGGIGYVLGTKAGRERYEQLRRTFFKVKDDPRVQEKAHQAADFVKEQAPHVTDKVGEAASVATDKIRHAASGSEDAKDKLHPDSTVHQDHPGPQGPLP
jgi:hypothetical protein